MKVKATAKGYFIGPREVDEEFDMPMNKDGSKPTSKWFVEVEVPEEKTSPAKSKKATVLGDEDLV